MACSVSKIGVVCFSLIVLSACNNKQNLIEISSEYLIKTYKCIDEVNTLKSKLNQKESFLLYIFSSNCLGCRIFEPVLNNYIKDNAAVIYAIDVSLVDFPTDNILVNYEYTPTISLIRDGKEYRSFNESNNSELFINSDNLKNELDKFVVVSNKVKVNNQNDLNYLIKNKDCLVYYHFPQCGDCLYFYEHFLKEELKKIKFKIYFFDMSYYFKKENQSIYLEFTKEMGLSREGSHFGYKNGVVPTLQKYLNGMLSSNTIIFNDEFLYNYNENNEIDSLKLIDSYYIDNPFINQMFKANNKSVLEDYHEKTLTFYIEKFKNVYI